MQKLSELLDAGHVALGVDAADVPSLLMTLAEMLVTHDHLTETCGRNLAKALLKREMLGGTCVGSGVAVPHAYVAEVPSPILLVARLQEPIAYGEPPDGLPVDVIFLLTGPASCQRAHVQVLARIVRLVHDKAWLEALRAADSPEAVLQTIRDVEHRHV